MARKELKTSLEKVSPPNSCGVYRFYNIEDELIYVGKSVNLKRRMNDYLTPSRRKKNRKRGTIVKETFRVEFEECADEKAALLLENQIIQSDRPKFNVAGAFSFLYPVIAAKYEDRRLALVRTTSPEEFDGFARFGAFRDRYLTNEMFESLQSLLAIVGHKEPRSRMSDIPVARYSSRAAYREIDIEYWQLLNDYLSGINIQFLPFLSESLLGHLSARSNAKEIEVHLKTLQVFYHEEACRLHKVCKNSGRSHYVAQEERDALFIEFDQR